MPLTSGNEYELRLFMLFLIYGSIAVGLNVLVGLTGLVSLGQAGLFALGSYAGAILAIRLGLDLVLASLGAAVVAGVFGVALAYPSVRVRGVYLAVVTIAFGLIVENVAIEWQGLTGGTTGLERHPGSEPVRSPPLRLRLLRRARRHALPGDAGGAQPEALGLRPGDAGSLSE